jgi:cation diffusion facilitator CzcD-associated flavoprotein CzcO
MMRILVIGAGPAGLAAAKNFLQLGLNVEVVERHDDVGGLWYFGSLGSVAYTNLHLNSSKQFSEFSDWPMPEDYPLFPSHRQAWEYLKSYAHHFRIYEIIRFNCTVTKVSSLPNGGWRVSFQEHPEKEYDIVIVASGFHQHPDYPDFYDDFKNSTIRCIHSCEYRSPQQLQEKTVLVVGCGNSAADIAVDAAMVARKTFISIRTGHYFLPKTVLGYPVDQFAAFFIKLRIPLFIRRLLFRQLLKVLVGDPSRYGFPKPQYRLLDYPPLLGTELLNQTQHGRIEPVAEVVALEKQTIVLKNQRRLDNVDLVIFCTGYQPTVPYLAHQYLNWHHHGPELSLYMFHPDRDDLFILGNLEIPYHLWQQPYLSYLQLIQ